LPGNKKLTSGEGYFAVVLETAGSKTVTVRDTVTTSITATSGSITVSAAAASHFSVTGSPSSITAGNSVNFTVTAQDPYGNLDSGYAGTFHFSSTDDLATMPPNSPLPGGTGLFSIALKRSGNQTLTVTDTSSTTITGTSNTITV